MNHKLAILSAVLLLCAGSIWASGFEVSPRTQTASGDCRLEALPAPFLVNPLFSSASTQSSSTFTCAGCMNVCEENFAACLASCFGAPPHCRNNCINEYNFCGDNCMYYCYT